MIAEASEWRIKGDGWSVRVWADDSCEHENMRWRAAIDFHDGVSSETIMCFAARPGEALEKLRAKMEPIGARLTLALAQPWALPPELKPALDFSEFEKR